MKSKLQNFLHSSRCSFRLDEFMCVIQDKVLGKVLYMGLSKQGLYPIPFELLLLLKRVSTTVSTPSCSSAMHVPASSAYLDKLVS